MQWTMININSRAWQGDAHLLRLPDKKVFLIDAGDSDGQLVPYLRSKAIHSIDKILISHAHKDHYIGIFAILAASIPIREVWMQFPVKKDCDRESPWGCDWKNLEKLRRALKSYAVPLKGPKQGDIYFESGNVKLQLLYLFDGINTPIGQTDINDTSMVLKLTHGKRSALFTGDLNLPMGKYLAQHGKNLSADIIKIPHHGAEGLAPNEFLEKVGAKLALVPAPKTLWDGDRCDRIRSYLQAKKIQTFVNGVDGNVTVEFHGDQYTVSANAGSWLK